MLYKATGLSNRRRKPGCKPRYLWPLCLSVHSQKQNQSTETETMFWATNLCQGRQTDSVNIESISA